MSSDLCSLPDREKIKTLYTDYLPILRRILESLERYLRTSVFLASMPSFKSRVKEFNSYYRKLLRVKPDDAVQPEHLPVLTDLLGIRIICAFLEDIAVVEQQIISLFDVLEIERKGADQTFKEFGYESIHILVKLPSAVIGETASCEVCPLSLPEDLICEIQIRTILQDAWAEVEHELVYKSEFSPFDLPLRRKLASMNASLCLSDIIFQEIRDYQNKLNRELDYRRSMFYGMADNLSRDFLPEIRSDTVSPFASASPFVRGTIDDLILEAIHAHNTGSIDKAIEIYTKIIDTDPSPNDTILSVILKHRGMAFFAQNQFESALNDFKGSVAKDPSNSRSLYYIGIVYCIMGQDLLAVDYFTQSLHLNKYQAHVYYRRALSYYKLADYSASMNDLAHARQLGLNDDDCRRLNAQLVSKFDMSV